MTYNFESRVLQALTDALEGREYATITQVRTERNKIDGTPDRYSGMGALASMLVHLSEDGKVEIVPGNPHSTPTVATLYRLKESS